MEFPNVIVLSSAGGKE